MIVRKFPYYCACGWHTDWTSAGSGITESLFEKVEQQLTVAKNPRAKSFWREMYRSALLGKINAQHQRGLVVCSTCKSAEEQLAFYDKKTGSLLHPILCNCCGEEAIMYGENEPIGCPACQKSVAPGASSTTKELLERLLRNYKITLPETVFENQLVVAIGSQAMSNLTDSGFPAATLEEKEKTDDNNLNMTLFSGVTRVVLHCDFENPIDGELSLLLLKILQVGNIETVVVAVAPPIFEGRKRIEGLMENVKQLQPVANQTIIVSGLVLEKQYGPSIQLYRKHIPQEVQKAIGNVLADFE